MSWFLNDKSFYDKAIEVLRRRKLYDPKVWSYSLHHNDEQTMREFVNKGTQFNKIRGTFLEAGGFTWKVPEYRDFKVLDYIPMVKPRVH